ncbi:MAG: MmcQ/YjbR family DNA-binding protein [Planctomycetes bacterium]|nr:MmcQ/YjbR family DNA-binding protein [Planctomycetota bacterium]
MPAERALKRYRAICLALPEAHETLTWGEPHFRVGAKIFGGYGLEDGRPVIGFKLERDHAAAIVADPRFRPAKYGGRHGWVAMDARSIDDWAQVRALVTESYRLIAPKRLVRALDAGVGMPKKPTRDRARPR